MKTVGLQTHIWNNNLRSILLIVLYPFMIMALAWVIAFVIGSALGGAGAYGHGVTEDLAKIASKSAVYFANHFIAGSWYLILAVVAIWFVVAYFFHTRMIRGLCKSHPVTRKEEPELYNLLENLCISRGIQMPQLEIIESHSRNAFASGISDATYKITVTRGLLHNLEKDEVEAVLAHELTHIINRDVRLLIVSVIFTGMVGFAAQMVWSTIRYNLHWGTRRAFAGRNSRSRGGDGRLLIVMFVILAVLWIGYFATMFTRFALSRRREYMADAGAINLTKNPEAMMRALMRISGRDKIPTATDDIALMCIENSRKFFGVFSTHPSTDSRISALSEVTGTPVPQLQDGGQVDPDKLLRPPYGLSPEWITKQRKLRKNPWIQPGKDQS